MTSINYPEKTVVLEGYSNITRSLIEFYSNVGNRCDGYSVTSGMSLMLQSEKTKQILSDLKKRGVRLRQITEVTKDNIRYCKDVMKVIELRHLENVRGGMEVSDYGFMVAVSVEPETPAPPQLIYSTVRQLVEQQQSIFEFLWNKATPAEQKIREIEEGVLPYNTKIVNNSEEIVQDIERIISNSNDLTACMTSGGMKYVQKYFNNTNKRLLDKQQARNHKRLRYVTKIDKDNLDIVELYLEHGIRVRDHKNLPPMNFIVSDRELAVTIENMEGGKEVQSCLISNEPVYVKHFMAVFEELWKKGIDAIDRVKDVEKGVDLADIEIIESPREGIGRAWAIIRSAKEEVSIMFSSANALRRQIQMGGLQLLREASEDNGVRVRLLVPSDYYHDSNKETGNNILQVIDEIRSICPKVNIRIIDKGLQTRITIVVSDKKECTITELKDDTRNISYSAAGLSTYSNSKSIVSSYVSIFESLWKQTELYEQLKIHDKMQNDFINIAAHELRTPVQPLLMVAESLMESFPYEERISMVKRNAERLQRLANLILDATLIESQTLELKLKKIRLSDLIASIYAECSHASDYTNNHISIRYGFVGINGKEEITYLNADESRLRQVVSNLLNNAIKSINERREEERFEMKTENKSKLMIGKQKNEEVMTITITITLNTLEPEVICNIEDSGIGLDPEIMPRLFSKFSAKSFEGIGLGLFICKGIIKAHGGKIWAENNESDSRGATFSFSLPVLKSIKLQPIDLIF